MDKNRSDGHLIIIIIKLLLWIEPLAKDATERDFCSLYIHERKGICRNDQSILEFLIPYLPTNQYKIRSWLRPDGLLLLFKTEEMARRVKTDLEMRDPEFSVDFWAIRPLNKKEGAEEEEEDREGEKEGKGEEGKGEEKERKYMERERFDNDNPFASLQEDE